jgi:protein-L-isoaspartate(D-aspartate) O-methyltransferase
MDDSIHHKQLRQALIDSLRTKGIHDEQVLAAMLKVRRHLFLDEECSAAEAYADKPLEIGQGQTISQPYTVAYQTQLLEVSKGDKVLEIGAGSGYQAAVLYELGAELHSMERQKQLFHRCRERLRQLGYAQIHLHFDDGNQGLRDQAPFDRILVTAAAPAIPSQLVDQLKVGGMMVIPVNGTLQKMLRVIKLSATETKVEEYDDFRFVPLLRGVVGE